MQKLLTTLLLSTLTLSGVYAQQIADTLFGSYIDLNGQLVHDYADQDYTPVKSIAVHINDQTTYLPGKYYALDGKVRRGQIDKLSTTKLNFRVDQVGKKELIDLTEISAVKIGADSFVVAKGFTVYGKVGVMVSSVPSPVLIQHLATTEKFEFFNYAPTTGSANYLVRRRNTKELISLPLTNKAFLEKANTLFGDYPQLLELLNTKKISPEEVAYLMRFIQYTDALQTAKPISYKANWEITNTPKDQAYYSVVSKDNTAWKLEFYNKSGERLFTEHYDYAHPSKQHGEVVWYYNGTEVIRKKRNYKMGVADKTYELFHRNGKLHYSILVSDFGNHHYQQVLTDQGISVLDKKGTGTEQFIDVAGKRTISREYLHGMLTSSYYTDTENRTVYQFARRNAKISNLKPYMAMIQEYVRYPESAIEAGDEGMVLVRFLISPDNQVEKFTIIRGISPSLDELIKGLANSHAPELRFKSGKHAKEEVYQEIVVPFRLSLMRQLVNSYYYNPTWMQHHMIHNPPLHHINPPAMPRM